ncbi:MAG: cupredoxin domain-containing protein [Ignavibacteriales bacterium]|nr:cupredoxin domain-containing protein [Ignavibacteriales bacterium]
MKSLFAFILLFAIGIGFISSSGCKDSSSPNGSYSSSPLPQQNPPNTILIKSFAFTPALDTISVGTTITWTNQDGAAHTSTSNSGAWDTGSIAPGASKTTVFNTAGTFLYHCTFHTSMTGTIVVK